MAKAPPIGIRLDPPIRAILERIAKAEDRPLAYVAQKMIESGLRQAGHLKPEAKPKRPRKTE